MRTGARWLFVWLSVVLVGETLLSAMNGDPYTMELLAVELKKTIPPAKPNAELLIHANNHSYRRR